MTYILSDPHFLFGMVAIIIVLIFITLDIMVIPTMILSIVSLSGWFIYLVYLFDKKKTISIVLGISFLILGIIYILIIIKFKIWRILSYQKNLFLEKSKINIKILNQKKIVATTDLHPTGKITVENKTHDALSIQGYIKKGELLTIIGYFGGQLKVRKKLIK
jgi:membrane-bound serine protease (ClpP class)